MLEKNRASFQRRAQSSELSIRGSDYQLKQDTMTAGTADNLATDQQQDIFFKAENMFQENNDMLNSTQYNSVFPTDFFNANSDRKISSENKSEVFREENQSDHARYKIISEQIESKPINDEDVTQSLDKDELIMQNKQNVKFDFFNQNEVQQQQHQAKISQKTMSENMFRRIYKIEQDSKQKGSIQNSKAQLKESGNLNNFICNNNQVASTRCQSAATEIEKLMTPLSFNNFIPPSQSSDNRIPILLQNSSFFGDQQPSSIQTFRQLHNSNTNNSYNSFYNNNHNRIAVNSDKKEPVKSFILNSTSKIIINSEKQKEKQEKTRFSIKNDHFPSEFRSRESNFTSTFSLSTNPHTTHHTMNSSNNNISNSGNGHLDNINNTNLYINSIIPNNGNSNFQINNNNLNNKNLKMGMTGHQINPNIQSELNLRNKQDISLNSKSPLTRTTKPQELKIKNGNRVSENQITDSKIQLYNTTAHFQEFNPGIQPNSTVEQQKENIIIYNMKTPEKSVHSNRFEGFPMRKSLNQMNIEKLKHTTNTERKEESITTNFPLANLPKNSLPNIFQHGQIRPRPHSYAPTSIQPTIQKDHHNQFIEQQKSVFQEGLKTYQNLHPKIQSSSSTLSNGVESHHNEGGQQHETIQPSRLRCQDTIMKILIEKDQSQQTLTLKDLDMRLHDNQSFTHRLNSQTYDHNQETNLLNDPCFCKNTLITEDNLNFSFSRDNTTQNSSKFEKNMSESKQTLKAQNDAFIKDLYGSDKKLNRNKDPIVVTGSGMQIATNIPGFNFQKGHKITNNKELRIESLKKQMSSNNNI